MENLAAAGISTICYNFMPILDWTRTELARKLPTELLCMRFDLIDFIVFDVFILNRNEAFKDYSKRLKVLAKKRFENMSKKQKENLTSNIVSDYQVQQKFSLLKTSKII